jgi:hypothetical protein
MIGLVFAPTFLARAVQLFALGLLFLFVFGWAQPKASAVKKNAELCQIIAPRKTLGAG